MGRLDFPIGASERLRRHILENYYNKGRKHCLPSEMWKALESFVKGLSTHGPRERRWINPLNTAGFYAVMLNATQLASRMEYPLQDDAFKTRNKGQVVGQRGKGPNDILASWRLPYRFGTESGGTNRASIGHVERYVAFLNEVESSRTGVDHLAAIVFWLRRTREFFKTSPIEISFNPNLTLRLFIKRTLEEVRKRERNVAGTKLTGLFMQHMVGAKLEILLGAGKVTHHSATQADQQYQRYGDFEIDETILHVTSAPTERLIEKCRENLDAFKKPVIVTLSSKTSTAEGLAENAERAHQIEIVEFESLMVSNLIERSLLKQKERRITVEELVEAYGRLVTKHDPVAGLGIVLR
ncbi:MAG: DUF4928 family protein [Rhodoplanes sp.]